MTVTITPDVLRPVAELLGCRAPARTVELLETAARAEGLPGAADGVG